MVSNLFGVKNKRYLKYLKLFPLLFFIFLVSCVSTPQVNVLGLQEMSVSSLDESEVKQYRVVNEHLSPEDMKSLNILIFDSDNCKQSAERLSTLTRDDLSYDDAVRAQNTVLKEYFKDGRLDFT